jgi:hypothetical protein
MLLRSGRNLLEQLPSKPVQHKNDCVYYDTIISKFREYLEPFKNPAEKHDFLTRIITFRQVFTLMYENFDCIMCREESASFTKVVREKITHWNEQISKVLMNEFINDKDFNDIQIRDEIKKTMVVVDELTKMFVRV